MLILYGSIVILNQRGISIKLALSQRDVLLAGSPRVGTVAVAVGNKDGRSLLSGSGNALGTHEVEVALALAAEFQVTLGEDVVDGDGVQTSKPARARTSFT